MKLSLQLSNVLRALVLFCPVVVAFLPGHVWADDRGVVDQLEARAHKNIPLPDLFCGLRSLRDERGLSGGLDLIGAWGCMQNVVMPGRYSDTNSDNQRPRHNKADDLKLRVRVRHDRVMFSVGVKW